ncbi:uncharacterized protein isoform X4 [Macaca fascicularis]|uniref:uncharacterized protein isoform X4 n=1 Tax=Macaca fascicularis TaxID=9541 RepID=UPI003D1547CF
MLELGILPWSPWTELRCAYSNRPGKSVQTPRGLQRGKCPLKVRRSGEEVPSGDCRCVNQHVRVGDFLDGEDFQHLELLNLLPTSCGFS